MIRLAKESDKELFIEMCKSFYSSSAVLHEVPEKHFAQTFDTYLKTPSAGLIIYVDEEDGVVRAYLLAASMYSNEAGGRTLWLDELFVKDEYRGAGIGKGLLEYAMRENTDVVRFRLELTKVNSSARKLYERMGFEILDYDQMVIDK